MNTISNFNIKLILAFLSIYIIWGTTYLAIEFALLGFPPFVISGLRFTIAGILILLFQYYKGEKQNSLSNWKKNAIPGILVLSAGTGLVAWAEQYVSATEAAIVLAITPILFIVIDKANWKKNFSDKFLNIGLLFGFGGLIIFLKDSLLSSEIADNNSFRTIAFGVLLLSAILWVLGSLYSKKHKSTHSLFLNVGQQLTVGGLGSLLIATFRSEWVEVQWISIPNSAWIALIYLIVFGSMVAYLAFIWLLSVKPPALVSTHTYINPVVAVVFGWLVARQFISGWQLFGLAIILAGVLLTNLGTYKISKRKAVRFRKFGYVLKRISNPYRYITHS